MTLQPLKPVGVSCYDVLYVLRQKANCKSKVCWQKQKLSDKLNVELQLLQCHPEANLRAWLLFAASTLFEPVQSSTSDDTLIGFPLRSQSSQLGTAVCFVATAE